MRRLARWLPEPMLCVVDHLFSSLDLNSKQAVVVTQHPYTAAPQGGTTSRCGECGEALREHRCEDRPA